MDPRQPAHIGEEVQFDFVLTDGWGTFVEPTGRADYCVVTVWVRGEWRSNPIGPAISGSLIG